MTDDKTPGPELPERREVPTHPTVKVHLMEDTGDWARDVVQIMARQDVAGTLAYMTVTDVDPLRRNEWCRHRLVMQVMDREEQIGVDDSTAQLFGLTIPENLAKALHEALEGRYGTNAAAALRTAEDLLEERDTELRELRQELALAQATLDGWEGVADERQVLVSRLEDHLADLQATANRDTNREAAMTEELAKVRERLYRAEAALESLRTPRYVTGDASAHPEGVRLPADGGRLSGAIHLEPAIHMCGLTYPGAEPDGLQPCRLPADGHKAHSDGVWAWNDDLIQRLAWPSILSDGD